MKNALAALLVIVALTGIASAQNLLTDSTMDGSLTVKNAGGAVETYPLGEWIAPGEAGWNQCWDMAGGVALYPKGGNEYNQTLYQLIAGPGVGSYDVSYDLDVVQPGQIYLYAIGLDNGDLIQESLGGYYNNGQGQWITEFNGGGPGAQPTGGWADFDYTLSITQDTDYVLIGVNAAQGADVQVDNVTMTPEPASMSLLALGGLAMLRRRK
jgi:hypothetical protein